MMLIIIITFDVFNVYQHFFFFFGYEAGLQITLRPNGHTALTESWRKCCLVNRNVYF